MCPRQKMVTSLGEDSATPKLRGLKGPGVVDAQEGESEYEASVKQVEWRGGIATEGTTQMDTPREFKFRQAWKGCRLGSDNKIPSGSLHEESVSRWKNEQESAQWRASVCHDGA